MIDPRDNRILWMLVRCTGGADAWEFPLEDPDRARADRVAAWVGVLGLAIVGLAVAGAIIIEAVRGAVAWA